MRKIKDLSYHFGPIIKITNEASVETARDRFVNRRYYIGLLFNWSDLFERMKDQLMSGLVRPVSVEIS